MYPRQQFQIDGYLKNVLKYFQIDPKIVLSQAGLPFDTLMSSSTMITLDEYIALWNTVERIYGSPSMFLELAGLVKIEHLTPPLFAAYASPNGMVALNRLVRYKRLITPIIITKEVHKDYVTLTISCIDPEKEVPFGQALFELSFIIKLLRMGTDSEIVPHGLTLTQVADDLDVFHFFKVFPTKGQANTITIKMDDLVKPFKYYNPVMWEYLGPELENRIKALEETTTFSATVSKSIAQLLPEGHKTIDAVSNQLGYSKRTIQRHLKGENTTFQQLLNHTRELLAKNYLKMPDMSIEEIAVLLAYDNTSSFIRAFQVWTNTSPSKYRANQS